MIRSDRVPTKLWTEIWDIVQKGGTKTMPKKKKCKKKFQNAKWLSEEVLHMAEKRREANAKEKRNDILIWIDSKAFFLTAE